MGKVSIFSISNNNHRRKLKRTFFITEHGIEGDDESNVNGQLSIAFNIDETNTSNFNLCISDMDTCNLHIGQRLKIGHKVVIEITELNFYNNTVNAYAKIVRGGWVSIMDEVVVTNDFLQLDIAIIDMVRLEEKYTWEERCHAELRSKLLGNGYILAGFEHLTYNKEAIRMSMNNWANRGVEIVLIIVSDTIKFYFSYDNLDRNTLFIIANRNDFVEDIFYKVQQYQKIRNKKYT